MGLRLIDYHRSMLGDEVRTSAYRAAIATVVKPGDVVVDIGTGSGILSFFACEAGASRVFSIEGGPMAGVAQLASRHLGFGNRVHVLRAHSTNVELPERANVLVTETMGSLGFDEGMLGFVLDARERFLVEGATIVPRRVALAIAPVEVHAEYDKYISWWSKPHYGFDFAPLRVFASNSLLFIDLRPGVEVARAQEILSVDLASFTSPLVGGKIAFEAERDADVHGFAVWFDATLAADIRVDSRRTQDSSWKQAFMALEVPIRVQRGQSIEVDLETDDGKSWTWRGKVAGEEFHQTTTLATAPYVPAG
jgi:predicted RNA methylase